MGRSLASLKSNGKDPALAERYRVVFFDCVGSGGSDLSSWSEEKYSPRTTRHTRALHAPAPAETYSRWQSDR